MKGSTVLLVLAMLVVILTTGYTQMIQSGEIQPLPGAALLLLRSFSLIVAFICGMKIGSKLLK